MPVKKIEKKTISQERLREIAWGIGKKYPVPLSTEFIVIQMVNPRYGCLFWNVHERSLKSLIRKTGSSLGNYKMIIRSYDVTDLIFDGTNAHEFFDIEINNNTGISYFVNNKIARNLIAEIGLQAEDGSFYSLTRSNTVFFDRDGTAANYNTGGLFVGGILNKTFFVENIFDAPVFERMNRQLRDSKKRKKISVAIVYLSMQKNRNTRDILGTFVRECAEKLKTFGGSVALYDVSITGEHKKIDEAMMKWIEKESKKISKKIIEDHEKMHYHLIHCHDWYSSKVGMTVVKNAQIPLVLSLHSTEYERTQGMEMDVFSSQISTWEKKAVKLADLVIVPHSTTRQQVITLYGASAEKVVIVPDVLDEKPGEHPGNVVGSKQFLGIPPEAPVVLFAGEMSHAAGADLLMEALPTICRNHRNVHFIFAGDGPLRGELEAKASHEGIGHRCRFLGHVHHASFESALMISDCVAIPARTWQDEGTARMAIEYGRPVLTTHQSGIKCVLHGKTGLLTFDNPGSIVWGIQELLFNPLKDTMLRMAVKKSARETPSLDSIAAHHFMHYKLILDSKAGKKHA